ncbi:hypothetical protein ACLOJK_001993 [Asimina triloba]
MRRGHQAHEMKYCRRPRMRVVRLGAGGSSNEGKRRQQQQGAIQAMPKLKLIGIPSPTKMLAWLRDAYVDAMLGVEGSTASYFRSRVEVAGLYRKRIPRRRGTNGQISGADLEYRVILETCNSLRAPTHLSAF